MPAENDARADCVRPAGQAPDIYPASCVAAIDGVTGRAGAGYATLRATLAGVTNVDAAGRAWAETLLQLAIVAAFLPVAYWLRGTMLYQRVLVGGGSAAIALVALLWLVQRAFDLRLIGG